MFLCWGWSLSSAIVECSCVGNSPADVPCRSQVRVLDRRQGERLQGPMQGHAVTLPLHHPATLGVGSSLLLFLGYCADRILRGVAADGRNSVATATATGVNNNRYEGLFCAYARHHTRRAVPGVPGSAKRRFLNRNCDIFGLSSPPQAIRQDPMLRQLAVCISIQFGLDAVFNWQCVVDVVRSRLNDKVFRAWAYPPPYPDDTRATR